MTKKLLVSGCSYGSVYSDLSQELKKMFAVDEIVNLSQLGGSPERQMRVVIEWIAQNGKPDMVILPVSYAYRFDLPIAEKLDPLHNKHYRCVWHMDLDKNYGTAKPIDPKYDKETLQTYLKTGAIIHQNEYPAHDDLFTRLLTFQSYLELNGIRHLIFDTGNYYSATLKENQPGMQKKALVENCKGIYKFFTFSSNVWMYQQLSDQEKVNYVPWYKPQRNKPIGKILPLTEAAIIHHNKFQVLKLLTYLQEQGAVYGTKE
jgi:hypothetical protein